MTFMEELNSMSLKDAATAISNKLIEQKYKLLEDKAKLAIKEKEAKEAYIAANTGDSSENAPLDEAKKNIRLVSGDIIANMKLLQELDNVEDVRFLVATYDYADIELALSSLDENVKPIINDAFNGLTTSNIREYFTALNIEDFEKSMLSLHNYMEASENNASLDALYGRLEEFFYIASMPEYNTCGIIKPYSTVRLECIPNANDKRIYTLRIYPAGLSFLDIGVLAANSSVAMSILEKEPDNGYITVGSARYRVLDLY